MQLPGAGFEVDMQDSSKVIMLGADEWRQAVFLCSPGSCSGGVGYDTRNWLELWTRFPKVGFGENTQTRVITA